MPPRREPLLSDVLRLATTDAHARLDTSLDLLTPPLSRERFIRVLEGFYGFHLAWEPALAAQPTCTEMIADRRRLPGLRADLRLLGRTDAEIDALPPCSTAADLCTEPAAARGSFYVMEGSTMGGQVIARALAQADWSPPSGLHYFNPYGRETGARWRAFKTWLDRSPAEDWPRVTAGAIATFAALTAWLARRP